ncbi:FAD-binding oxidoreductase [Novosphingobium sp.]|uniref:NAD(P)/FAD-dependent oxidoreductase n=1 Tax=Novosphingobium sp. TaxID=1874826 RepID=UPI001DDDC5CF|nr:FAD-binding oxidoreductase [Novosphingobium sp.]MBX9665411.1 FAD-binding oxidoreductase [Novosphingobium sp.]
MAEPEFFESSPWIAGGVVRQPALAGAVTADVVIVGGGFTGLSTALCLREAGVDVAIVERDHCGFGASGRNAGHLTPTIGKDFPTLVKYVGKDRAVEYARFADRAVHYTEAMITRLGVDCEYRPTGNIITGLHPRHRKPLADSAELAASLGVGVAFLDEAEVRRRNLPSHVRFGVIEQSGGHLHPGKYVLALRQAALDAGVRIFEDSAVTAIEDTASPIVVRTAAGHVTAEKLVVATNAYTPATLGQMKSKVFPVRVTLFRTAPLTPAQWDRIGWQGREALYTAHEAMENYRPQADGRISGGSKWVQYGFGSTLTTGHLPKVFAQWRKLFALRFPELPDVGIESFWGGWIGLTLDFLPLHGSNARGTVFHGLGYNGHGIAQATYAGPMLADQVLGRSNAEVELFQRRLFPLPPEPLRWLVIKGITATLDRVDNRVDADLARGTV